MSLKKDKNLLIDTCAKLIERNAYARERYEYRVGSKLLWCSTSLQKTVSYLCLRLRPQQVTAYHHFVIIKLDTRSFAYSFSSQILCLFLLLRSISKNRPKLKTSPLL